MAQLNFNVSESVRLKLDKEQQKQISQFYQNLAKEVKEKSKKFEGKDNISSTLRLQYLKQLEKEMKSAFVESEKKIGNIIKDNMLKISDTVVTDNDKWMEKLGMPSGGSLLNIPKDIVEKVITGNLYNSDWTLNKALWKDVTKKQSDINRVIAEGIAQNKSAYDIAKDLEKYVDPNARKDWKWSKAYPNTNKVIDYNAQRLSRTMVSHAYQQSIVTITKPNPFVEGLKWRATGGTRMCPICSDRDGEVFDKNKLPLDHPNGMCTFIAVTMDDNIIIDRLANWAKGGKDAELDRFWTTLKAPEVKQSKLKNNKDLKNDYIDLEKNQAAAKRFDLFYRNKFESLYADNYSKYNSIAESYTGGEYELINKFLRTGKFDSSLAVEIGSEKELLETIKNAKAAITGIPCPNNIIVHRRVSSLGDMSQHTQGSEYLSKQFLSSTTDAKKYESYDGKSFSSFGEVQIDIKVPKGYDKGAFIHSISMQRDEYEFLFAPDTKFDIIEMSKDKVVLLAK